MVTVNVVVLAGTVSAEPVQRRMPSGDEVTELRLSVPESASASSPSRSRRGTPRSASERSERSPRAIGCSCTGSWSVASTGAEPAHAASPRSSRAASRSSIHPRARSADQRHHDHAGPRLGPEVGRFLRQPLTTLDDRANAAGRGGRQQVRRDAVPTAHGGVGLPRRPARTAATRRRPAASSISSCRARTAGGAPGEPTHAVGDARPWARSRSCRRSACRPRAPRGCFAGRASPRPRPPAPVRRVGPDGTGAPAARRRSSRPRGS